MAGTFTKLFSSITESSVWYESDHTRLVWITMLALSDKYGKVWASVPGLAGRARVPIESCVAALETFLKPDPHSRSSAFEGRRIEIMEGGWKLLNYQRFRKLRNEEELRAYKTEKEREYRKRKRGIERGQTWNNVEFGGTKEKEPEKETKKESTKERSKEREQEKESVFVLSSLETKQSTSKTREGFILPDWVDREAWDGYEEMRRRIRKPMTDRARKIAITKLLNLSRGNPDLAKAVLDRAIFNSWQGLWDSEGGTKPPELRQPNFPIPQSEVELSEAIRKQKEKV